MNVQNLRSTVKYDGDSVILFVGNTVPVNGIGNLAFIYGILDKYKYLNIIQNN